MSETINETVKLILSLSVSGGLFALALFALKPLMRNRLSKSFQYYIWLVVLLRFIVPFSFGINLMDFTFNTPNAPQAVEETVISNSNPANINSAVNNNAANNSNPNIAEPQPSTPISTDSAKPFDILKTVADNLLWIWLAGALVSAAFNVLGYLRFIRYIHGAAYAVEMPDCGAKVYKSRFTPTPMLVGVIRPRIYLPDIEYTDGQLNNILLHELTHLRRRDVLLKWLAALVVSVHWFNPLVYFMRREFNRACELSCDEVVIRNLDIAAKQSYGDTLISVVAESRYPVGVMSVTMCEEKKKLKERLVAIMNYKRKTKIAVLITAVLAVLITGSAFAFGAGMETKIKLPDADTVLSVTMNQYNEYAPIGEVVIKDKAEIENILYTLSGATKTWRQSVNDYPIEDNYLVIRLHLANEMRTLCLYTDGVDYIEEPYVGIYRPKTKFDYLYSVYAAYGYDKSTETQGTDSDSYSISLAELRQLAAKGDELVWEDFSDYNGQSALSGLYGMLFKIENGYTLLVGSGSPSGKPLYAMLQIPGIEENIDIRYDDIDVFISKYPVPNELSGQIYGYLDTIMSSPLYSSATGDYIEAHQAEYDAIVDMGVTALPTLTGILNVGDMSLRGNIAALLVQDIVAEENSSNKAYSEWRDDVIHSAASDVERWSRGFPPNDSPATRDEEADEADTSIKGRIISGNVSAVYVELSIVWEGLSPRKYTSPEKIAAVLDYINGLNLKDNFSENPNEYDGATFTITVIFEDGTEKVYYHFGNMFFGTETENGFEWYRMEYEQAVKLERIIYNNESD